MFPVMLYWHVKSRTDSHTDRVSNGAENQEGLPMLQVNIADAGTELANLVNLIQSGQEHSVILVKDGKPVAKVEGYAEEPDGRNVRIGIAEGKLVYPDDIHAFDDEIAEMFGA